MAESENRVSSRIGSSFELEGYLRCFGKPITVFFHVVSVAGRDYGFLRCLSDLDPGLPGSPGTSENSGMAGMAGKPTVSSKKAVHE